MGTVFISYRREETSGEARALFNDLVARIGKDLVFMDVDNIALGRDFREVLRENLASCDLMLVLIGKGWVDAKDQSGRRRLDDPGDFIRLEIGAALKRNIPVTPVLLQGAHMPAPEQLPEDLKELSFRNGFELSHTRWESDVQEMIKRLALGKRPDVAAPSRLTERGGNTLREKLTKALSRGRWALVLAIAAVGGGLLYYMKYYPQPPKTDTTIHSPGGSPALPERAAERESKSKGPAPPSSRELEGTTISSKTPSSDISSPSPLYLGEVVKGRLGNSDETGIFHFWLVDFPVGSFKIVLDVRRSDLNNSNVGGLVQFFSTDGEKLDLSCAMNQVDYRWRQICGFTVRGAFKSVLRYSNAFTVSDYWLGVFKSDAPVKSPFFDKSPPVLPVKLGQRVTATLDGSQPPERDAWYSFRLRPGDYKLSVEYKRADGQKGNVGGMLNTYGPDGNYSSSANGANDVDFSAKAVSRLSLADDTSMLFRISAAFTKELVTFEIEPAKEQ